MEDKQILRGTDISPMDTEAEIVLSGHELATAVGAYVEEKYGVTACSVIFEMRRLGSYFSRKGSAKAFIQITRRNL